MGTWDRVAAAPRADRHALDRLKGAARLRTGPS
jgi:hypothetical protein